MRSTMRFIMRAGAPLFVLSGLALAAAAAEPLPRLAANRDAVTVSGLSSGAYMAVQMQVAHSQLIRGVGVIAGGPYDCARGSAFRALKNCMSATPDAPPPTVDEQRKGLADAEKAGAIDAVANLRGHRAWLFSGANDKTVAPQVVDALAGFYGTQMPAEALRHVKHPEAGHAMISIADPQPNACSTSEPPYINRCQGMDAAGALLAHLLGPLQPAGSAPAGRIVAFDQQAFFAGKAIDASMADEGYAYIPDACRNGGCRVHVVFHGCKQSATAIGRRFVEGAGYNAWADTNRLIILYPQATARQGAAFKSWKWVYNPKGCWDWWGYTGDDYATRDGTQIRGVKRMVDRLLEPFVN
jgi:poly(3-hydroxybutyrate) depolymerase